MNHVDIGFARIAYESHGSGPAVVLLHANAHDHRDFDAIVPALARGSRTIAIDWPEHGDSTWADARPLSLPSAYRDVVSGIVDALELERVAIVGNSVGGYAAAAYALQHPERVSRLVLVNSGGFLRPTPLTRTTCRVLGNESWNRRIMPTLVDRYMRATTENDRMIAARVKARLATAGGTATCAALWRSFNAPEYDLRARGGDLECPTLLLWGAQDPILGGRAARQAEAAIPHAELRTLPTGHVPFSSAPEEFVAAYDDFAVRSDAH